MNERRVKVWDPLLRAFHWSLVAAVLTSLLTEDEWLDLHILAGYLVLALIGIRLLWGLAGPRHARFQDFLRSPSATLAYLRDLARGRARRYLGHNPAGGLMVVLLLASLIMTGLSGIALLGAQELTGPLAPWLADTPGWAADLLEEVHELLGNLVLVLVLVHVAAVFVMSAMHRENLVRAMFTGYKKESN